MPDNQTNAVRFNFKPEYWRDNFKLEARLRADGLQKLIEKICFRRPFVAVFVSLENEVQFRFLLEENLYGEMVS